MNTITICASAATFAVLVSTAVPAMEHAGGPGNMGGQASEIDAPVQTADPDFQGGERVNVVVRANPAGQRGAVAGVRVGMELAVPVYQDLNGPQMASDWSFSIGAKYMF